MSPTEKQQESETGFKCEICGNSTDAIMIGYDTKDDNKPKKMCSKCFVEHDLGPNMFGF